tara:strand:- start:2040 stop:2510 length:471 start_codon:yes stop_codon:yes gene_type:complete
MMGTPRKSKKKYRTPKHPWAATKLQEEKKIVKEYGLRNKRELWRADTILRNYHRQARKLLVLGSNFAENAEKQIFESMLKNRLLKEGGNLDNILALKIENILDRRLQTIVYKKGFANTLKHSRQLIVHGHVTVNGGKVTAPSYMVKAIEEDSIKVI